MDFSAQLEKLQQQANETAASIQSASAESRDQLKQRIDQARVDANLALMDLKQQAEQTSDQVQGGFYESMQHLSVMRAFAPRLGGYLSGLVWRLFLWRNGMPGCRSRGLSGGVR
jgi:hypothetical protein